MSTAAKKDAWIAALEIPSSKATDHLIGWHFLKLPFAAWSGVRALIQDESNITARIKHIILVFIGFNLTLKVDAKIWTAKANPPAIFQRTYTLKKNWKSYSSLRNTTRVSKVEIKSKV